MNAIKDVINWLASPAIAVTLSMVGLVAAMFTKALWTKKGGLVLFATLVGGFVFSFTDPNFRIVATTPDNVPILGMLFLVGLLLLVRDVPGAPERRAAREGPPAAREGRQRQEGLLLAGPRLRRAHRPRRLLDRDDRVVDRPQGAARGAREPGRRAEPREGALVLPRPPGAARLLRPVDGGRRPPDAHHRRPHGDPVHRHEPARQRLLLLPRAEVGDPHVLLRVRHPVGRPHHPRDVPARAELELLRALRGAGTRTSSSR